jgi:hypothetical protein
MQFSDELEIRGIRGEPRHIAGRWAPTDLLNIKHINTSQILATAQSLEKPVEFSRNRERNE